METFGIIGMTFGMIAWGLVAKLQKEVDDLKKNLKESGVLESESEPESE